MRKRQWTVLAATAVTAVALIAGVGWHADADPVAGPDDAGTASDTTVTLPTGDPVVVRGELLDPAPSGDRAGMSFQTMTLPGGDRMLVPLDRVAEVYSGAEDDRRYNVDALLRNGITDARTVDDPDMLGRSLTAPRATADATTVTLEPTWRDPDVTPTDIGSAWTNLDTGQTGTFGGDGSKPITVDLVPGRYALMSWMVVEGDAFQYIGDVTQIDVADAAVTIPVDGTAAKPVGFDVDRPAEPTGQEEGLFVQPDCDCDKVLAGFFGTGDDEVFMIPSGDGDAERGLMLRETLAGADGTFSYNLAHVSADGIPADPVFAVSDADLAARDVDYADLGGTGELGRIVVGEHSDYPTIGPLTGETIAIPGRHTELFSTGFDWSTFHTVANPDGSGDDLPRHYGEMEPGTETIDSLSAPVSVGSIDPDVPWYGWGVYRGTVDGANYINAAVPLFDGPVDGDTIMSGNLPGRAVLSKEGKELGSSDTGSELGVDLPEGDEGRYTVALGGTRDAAWTTLGIESSVEFEFDSAPVTEDTMLPVSVVEFDADGITDGYADAAKPQNVDLEFSTQPGTDDRACADLTFAVSYDEGDTWQPVDIDRDGDHATGELHHPQGATSVSVRFTAEDDLGQTVEQHTIRSYGLR